MADEDVLDPEVDATAETETPSAEETPPARDEVAELREQNRMLQETLRVLGQSHSQPATPAAPARAAAPSVAERVKALAAATGYSEESIQPYLPILDAYANMIAQPLGNALERLADDNDRLNALVTVEDYHAIQTEAEKVREEFRGRGLFISRADAAAVARSRVSEQEAKVAKRQASAASQQQAKARRAGREGGAHAEVPLQTASPARPTKQAKTYSREELLRLPRDERLKVMDEIAGDNLI